MELLGVSRSCAWGSQVEAWCLTPVTPLPWCSQHHLESPGASRSKCGCCDLLWVQCHLQPGCRAGPRGLKEHGVGSAGSPENPPNCAFPR